MNSFVKPHSISVGYNRKGQSFFDIINKPEYRDYIHSYFFSLNRGMMSEDGYDPYDVAKELSQCNRYGIPANLLFNDLDSYHNIDGLIKIFSEVEDLPAVTILEPGVAPYLKEKHPDIEIHLSVRFWDWKHEHPCTLFNRYYELITEYIDVVNISGQLSYNDHAIFDLLKYHGIKTKMIVNEGCIINRSNNFKNFPGYESANCFCGSCSRLCDKVVQTYPWMCLTTINIYKETLKFFDYDILKISSRSLDNNAMENLLMYWANNNPTHHIFIPSVKSRSVDITNKYDIFMEWLKTKSSCSGDCYHCQKCKSIYEELIKKDRGIN